MANIRERNGSYQFAVYVGQTADKKKIYKYLEYTPEAKTPAKIKKEVEKAALEFENEVKNGLYSDSRITVEQYANEWIERYPKLKNLAPRTTDDYRKILNSIIPYIGYIRLKDLKAKHINDLYSKLVERKLSSTTIKKYHAVLSKMLNFAYKEDTIAYNPIDKVTIPKLEKNGNIPNVFTESQSKAFLRALESEYTVSYKDRERTNKNTGEKYHVSGYTDTFTSHIQHIVYFNLALTGGFRRGELIGLTWECIDFKNNSITIKQAAYRLKESQHIKLPKTESGIRVVYLPSYCFELLKKWKKEQKELYRNLGTRWKGFPEIQFDKNFVFIQIDNGLMMNLDTPYHVMKDTIKRYNTNCTEKSQMLPNLRLHDLRHTFASIAIANGCDIVTLSYIMGHNSPTTTMKIYAHFIPSKANISAIIMERALG